MLKVLVEVDGASEQGVKILEYLLILRVPPDIVPELHRLGAGFGGLKTFVLG